MQRTIQKKLQQALNYYLALDPESKPKLFHLDNKVVTIELQGVNVTFQLHFKTGTIQLHFTDFIDANTIIKGKPLSMLHMALTPQQRKRFFEDDVSIEGDIELGQDVIDLFDTLEIDWEEYVSQYIGDIPAHQINRVARKIQQFGKRLNDSLQQSTNEYVHEEKNLFPPKEALADFFKEVDELRMDTDRIEARIKNLEAQRK